MRLFARDIKGNIKEWNIALLTDTTASIRTGRVNSNLIETIIEHPHINKEIASRIAKKRKEGYVSLKDTGHSGIIDQTYNLTDWLNANLPQFNSDANNNLKPMKCQKFQEGKVKYPVLAQPKLNGLRAVIRWEVWEEGDGLFKTKIEGAKIRTKEGNEYVMPHITSTLTKDLFYRNEVELVYDGELYKHGMPLNEIKASCPMTNHLGTISRSKNDPSKIEFHSFDLAIPDMLQNNRLITLENSNISDELTIKKVPYLWLASDKAVLEYRDVCINYGYEGCVIRDPNEEYAFGFRPSFIRKVKTHIDSEFLIVAIISKPSDPTLPLFILKNDINEETFECNPTGKWEYQREILENSNDYIGKWATVRYRERTGTDKKLPFHANVIDIRDKRS